MAFTAHDKTQELISRQMLYLTAGEPHVLIAADDGDSFIVYIRRYWHASV